MIFELQLALVLLCLARGLLDFIWSIRQLNYCIAAVGAVPDPIPSGREASYAEVAARLINPACAASRTRKCSAACQPINISQTTANAP